MKNTLDNASITYQLCVITRLQRSKQNEKQLAALSLQVKRRRGYSAADQAR